MIELKGVDATVRDSTSRSSKSWWAKNVRSRIGLVDGIVLLVVAAYSPLEVAAVNFIGIVHPERLGMVVAIGWLIGLVLLLLGSGAILVALFRRGADDMAIRADERRAPIPGL